MAGRYEGAFSLPPTEILTADDITSRRLLAAAHERLANDYAARAQQHRDLADAIVHEIRDFERAQEAAAFDAQSIDWANETPRPALIIVD